MPGVKAHFDSRAAGYQAGSGRGLWAWQRARESAALLDLCGPVGGRAVLDLGCGSGFYARRLAELGAATVMAVDISERMIAAIDDPRIATRVGDLATLRLEARFDLVLLAGVLEFTADPAAALANAAGHLAEGGRLAALLPRRNWAGGLYRRYHRGHGFRVALFDRGEFAELARACGLGLAAWRPLFPFGAACAMVRR